jgi:hypothetical protein
MPIRPIFKKKFQNVTLQSGYFYQFKYSAYRHDPHPIIIFMNGFAGVNDNAGNQWRFLQAINLNYVPRNVRKRFVSDWLKELEKPGGDIKFTWKRKILPKYPYLKHAIRRYFYIPAYYITKLEEIPLEDVEKVVVKSLWKDFSTKIKSSLLSKFRNTILNRQKKKNKK